MDGSMSTRRQGRTLAAGLGTVAIVAVAGTLSLLAQAPVSTTGEWPQWGGPDRNFMVHATGLADSWPESGPPVLWSRPLGLGHSAIVVDEGRLFTLYRPGKQVTRTGPWEPEEVVIAMDAATGRTLWEHRYPSEPFDFSQGPGPHSTPLVAGDRLFATGTNKLVHALDKRTGKLIWARDLVKDFGAPPRLIRPAVKAGYAVSPLAYEDTIIIQAGGDGQAVMALKQNDGSVAWKSGDFLVSESSPILIDVDGQPQVVVFAAQAVYGLAPRTGRILWSHEHDTSGDMNNSTPIWGPDNVLLISSGYNQGTRALRLTRQGETTRVEELWFTNRLKVMFANALRIGDHLYASHGDFGPAVTTALNIQTGQVVWQKRGFGRSSFVHADGKAIIIDEDGDLALARLSPDGMVVLAQAKIFDTVSWTAPSLVGTTLYARDREKIMALNLGK
jgi:outer membrane protein assembly factor BamB